MKTQKGWLVKASPFFVPLYFSDNAELVDFVKDLKKTVVFIHALRVIRTPFEHIAQLPGVIAKSNSPIKCEGRGAIAQSVIRTV